MLINGKSFFDMTIKNGAETYEQILEMGRNNDYTTGNFLDYQYFKDHCNLIAVDLSKQKELVADSRAVQQIESYGMLKTDSQVCTVLEKSKETMLQFSKGTTKVQ